MRYMIFSSIIGMLLVIIAGIIDIKYPVKEEYSVVCLKEQKKEVIFPDKSDCISKRECRNTTALYLIGAFLSLTSNAIYAYIYFDDKKHRRNIEEQMLRS